MMYIKLMSDENLADTDATKRFAMITVGDKDKVDFKYQEYLDKPPEPVLVITEESGDTTPYFMEGNVYIMNQNGKTIAHYSPFVHIHN